MTGTTFTDTSEFSASVAVSNPFAVTTTTATGFGSLEQAILNANADTTNPNPDTITFAITTGSAPYTISLPATGLTPITHPVVLDATTQPGFAGSPIIVLNGGKGAVLGSGLVLSSGSGGSTISGLDLIDFTNPDTDAIDIASSGNVVLANFIGVGTNGTTAGGNEQGILVNGPNNTIGGTATGAGNVIANNTGAAVYVNGASSNAIRENSIFANGSGIVLPSGANGGQLPPALETVTITPAQTLLSGRLTGTASGTNYTIEFFSSGSSTPGANQAQVFLGSVAVAGNGGTVTFNATLPLTLPSGQTVVATVTSGANNTSAFSNFLTVYTGFVVTTTADNATTPVAGSLRQVIDNVNANPPASGTTDTITFNISSGPQTIALAGTLPAITVPVTIDGTTQPGYAGTPLIELSGNGVMGDGLTLASGSSGSTVSALDIVDFNGNGITIQSNSDVIKDDYIGTTFNGTSFVAGPANQTGILISGSNNTIGGTASGDGNVIAFNAANAVNVASGSGNAIRQNLIFSSGSTPILLTGTANNTQAAPTNLAFTSVPNLTTIQGQITGTVGSIDTLEFFASSIAGASPAAVFLGTTTVTLSASPESFTATFNLPTALAGSQTVTATATGPDNSSSEFATSASFSDPYVVSTGTDGVIGSLRQAIIDSNVAPGTPITFTLPAPYVINLTSALPSITVPVTINGTSLPGYDPLSPTDPVLVELNANGVAGNGLTLGSGSSGSTIEGLDLVGFQSGAAINAESNGNLIEENYAGGILEANPVAGATFPQVTSDPNSVGFSISGSANTIGGTSPDARNVIGFNTSAGIQITGTSAAPNNLVVGNDIGTDPASDNLGNAAAIQIFSSSNNTIGGTTNGAGNTIGFNTSIGIAVLSGTGNTILQNTYTATNGPSVPVETNDIGLGPNANNNQPAPNLVSAVTEGNKLSVLFTENLTNASVVLDFYEVDSASSPAEREFLGAFTQFVASVNTQYVAAFTPSVTIGINDTIIATATVTSTGNTSAFSGRVAVSSSLTVINTNNSGQGSLYDAIMTADSNPGSTIAFAIPTTDGGYDPATQTFTIALTTALPPITAGVTIDGTTESSYLSGQPAVIEIEDNATPGIADGLDLVSGSGTSIFGLKIVGFTGAGILVQTADNVIGGAGASANIIGSNGGAGVSISGASATGNIVSGNYIGTDSAGDNLANAVGVEVDSASNSIGGPATAAANVIGFNTSAGVSITGASNVVEGNFIGTSPTNSTFPQGNAVGVAITNAANNMIGGTSSGFANIIGFNTASGTTGAGVSISGTASTGNLIAGNDIGINASGIVMPNDAGVVINDSSDNTIGGSASGAGNTSAFNTGDAVCVISGTGNPILENPIFSNGSGIVLSSDGNDDQVYPTIVGATSVATGANTADATITVSLTGPGFSTSSTYSLDFFASALGDPSSEVEAHIYLGTQTFTGGTTGTVTFTSL